MSGHVRVCVRMRAQGRVRVFVCMFDVPACTRSHECVCVTGHMRPLTLREALHVRHGASQGQLRRGRRDVDMQQQ